MKLGSETVAYGGKNLAALRQRIGMVFQSYELFPHLTVLENILLAPTKVQKRPRAEVQQEAEALLDRVGLLVRGEPMFRAVRNSVSPLCARSVCTPRSCCSTK